MELTIRAATPGERLYAYEQSAQIAEKCGSPGYLHGGLDNTGTVFLSRWERNAVPENTPEFKGEFDTVLDMGFCYEELGEYDKAYEIWLWIARDLEKDGCEIEKQFPLELAEKCKAILADHPT